MRGRPAGREVTRAALALLAALTLAAPGRAAGAPPAGAVAAEDDDGHAPEAPRPETAYHRVTLRLDVGASRAGDWVRALLPRSDGRQVIVARDVAAEGFRTEELAEEPNLVGRWTRREAGPGSVVEVEMLAETAALEVEAPAAPFPPGPPAPEAAGLLRPTALVQSDDPAIAAVARERTRGADAMPAALRALHDAVASLGESAGAADGPVDARSVLRDGRGNATGKARLLAALLRSAGIPAELVGGLRLAETDASRATTSWVEARVAGRWFPMDPANGHFGRLPASHLTLYRGDRPLLVHRRGMTVDYAFRVRPVTRPAAREAGALRTRRAEAAPAADADGVEAAATYVERPVARVVLLSEGATPAADLERLAAEARAERTDLVVLAASRPSRYFRESALGRAAATHLAAVRDADVLVVSGRDEGAIYALLGLGEGGLRLRDARVLVAGDFSPRAGEVLGAVLASVLEPTELAIVPHAAPAAALWGAIRPAVASGASVADAARAAGLDAVRIDAARTASFSAYRRAVIAAWARAVRARVPLAGLNLILVLPVIAFVVVVARNVVGLETFGTFSPVIVSLAFLTTGLLWGAIVFVAIVGIGALLRVALQRLRLQLVARIAILIGLVSGVMTGLTVIGAWFGIGALLHASLFPMAIMSNLIEKFAASQVEYGTREAVRVTANTLLVCAACYALVEGTGLPSWILAFPELLLAVLGLEIAAGKWRGLRLVEYARFRDLGGDTRPGGS